MKTDFKPTNPIAATWVTTRLVTRDPRHARAETVVGVGWRLAGAAQNATKLASVLTYMIYVTRLMWWWDHGGAAITGNSPVARDRGSGGSAACGAHWDSPNLERMLAGASPEHGDHRLVVACRRWWSESSSRRWSMHGGRAVAGENLFSCELRENVECDLSAKWRKELRT